MTIILFGAGFSREKLLLTLSDAFTEVELIDSGEYLAGNS